MEDRMEENNLGDHSCQESTPINPMLVHITKTNPITPLCIYIPIVIALSWVGLMHFTVKHFLMGFGLGLFLWTFIEYAMHRFFYHFEPSKENKFMYIFLMLTHGLHHEKPQDKTRLVSITLVSLSYTLGIALIYFVLFRQYFIAVMAGTLLGYIIYDLVHYEVHVANRKNRLFQYLKRYHFSHHYINNAKGFGVTSPFWDYVFGTRASFITGKQKLSPK